MSWVRRSGDVSGLYFSSWDGSAWSPESLVASGDNWFNNWADFPSVVPINGELWAAHWLVQSADQHYAYDVFVALSVDAGITWQPSRKIHSDGTASEHGFVSLYSDEGEAAAVWLDGRNTLLQNVPKPERGMTLRSARILPEGFIERPLQVDSFTCDCCGTDVAPTKHGPMVVYRDRSEDEVRDISAAHLTKSAWSAPFQIAPDNWVIEGCPVNGPTLDSLGNRVVVAWFTRAQDRARVNLAWSDNGGLDFFKPVEIASTGTQGRVDVVLISEGQAAVSWLEVPPGEEQARLMITYVDRDHQVSDALTATEIIRLENSRSAGFPQMIGFDGQLFFAWTDSTHKQVFAAALSTGRSHL